MVFLHCLFPYHLVKHNNRKKYMAGEALLGAAFSVLLDRLTSPELVKFFRGRKHDERLLKKLKLKLLGLNKVLNDAEDKQITHRAVKEWLDELKDAVYHAEDLVDEIATEALRCKVEAENQSGPNQETVPSQQLATSRSNKSLWGKLPTVIELFTWDTLWSQHQSQMFLPSQLVYIIGFNSTHARTKG